MQTTRKVPYIAPRDRRLDEISGLRQVPYRKLAVLMQIWQLPNLGLLVSNKMGTISLSEN